MSFMFSAALINSVSLEADGPTGPLPPPEVDDIDTPVEAVVCLVVVLR